MTRQRRNDEIKMVAKRTCAFHGGLVPLGPMYVAVTSPREEYGDSGVILDDCYSLRELRARIDRLKSDLDWVYKGLEREKQQARGTAAGGQAEETAT